MIIVQLTHRQAQTKSDFGGHFDLPSFDPYAAKYHNVYCPWGCQRLVGEEALVGQLHANYLLKIKPTPLYAFCHQVLQDIHMNEHRQTESD